MLRVSKRTIYYWVAKGRFPRSDVEFGSHVDAARAGIEEAVRAGICSEEDCGEDRARESLADPRDEAGGEHLAAKVVSQLDRVRLTDYVSWDDVHEDNYQRITLDQFAENPDWDRLTGAWTGVPHIEQAYRRG